MHDSLRNIALKLLEHDVFHIGKKHPTYDFFPEFIKERLTDYVKVIREKDFWEKFIAVHYPNNPETIKSLDTFLKMIENFCANINNCVEAYYLGKVNEAYKYLSLGLNKNILWTTSKLFEEAITEIKPGELKLYRIRKKNEEEFEKGDLFHIPFQKRHKVSTQRFSIPGYPSLYLGDSIYVCWEELGKPPVRDIYACRFNNVESVHVIEIIRVEDFVERVKKIKDNELSSEIFRFILTYPLTIACTVKTKVRDAIFKPEYIIPQLFLQFIMENKEEHINGVRYFSTRVPSSKVDSVGIYNYVFPAKSFKNIGFCDALINMFEFTEPIFWEHEEIFKSPTGYFKNPGSAAIELNSGRKLPYDWSAFRKIETVLEGVSTSKLT